MLKCILGVGHTCMRAQHAYSQGTQLPRRPCTHLGPSSPGRPTKRALRALGTPQAIPLLHILCQDCQSEGLLFTRLSGCHWQSSSIAPLQGQSNLEEHQRVHDAVVRKSSQVLAQFVELQERCNQLVGEVEAAQGQLPH